LRRGTFRKRYTVTGYETKAKVIKADVDAGSSVIHIIDKVLIPKLSK
jgi:uncharacterized surface protein with fasciclin (FAS1) repeats